MSPFPGTIGETAEQICAAGGTSVAISADLPDAEPPAVMAEAALMLCSAGPKALTGRIAYSQQLLSELTRD